MLTQTTTTTNNDITEIKTPAIKHSHKHSAEHHPVPPEEQPILQELYNFRKGLQNLRRESKGAVTLADVDVKANELAEIMTKLRTIRSSSIHCERNRIDDVLDSIWMILFFIWGNIAGIDETLYPTYVELVSLCRVSEALKKSGAWLPHDVEPLLERLKGLEEKVQGGLFLDPSQPKETEIPAGQAVLHSLLSRAHRTLAILQEDSDSVAEELVPVYEDLKNISEELEEMQVQGGYCLEMLAPFSDRLHTIDVCRGPHGRFTNFSSPTPPSGQATCAGLLAHCFELLTSMISDLDPVHPSSPLHPLSLELTRILQELESIKSNPAIRSNPTLLHEALTPLQHALSLTEKQRVDGTFFPTDEEISIGMSTNAAAVLPGQASLHKLLHKVHSLVTSLIDPLCLPVSETLVGTYELLLSQRSKLRELRKRAALGRNLNAISSEVDAIAKTLDGVESSKVDGFFLGAGLKAVSPSKEDGGDVMVGDDGFEWLKPQGRHPLSPDGQGVVSALVDECDSLLWEVRCIVVVRGGN
ncbi:hypothetical protein HDV05_001579 [Chytridiales sp. JEL 0842]|nr:hypothetical protein HDV05_001579 [Chytridiales sp. JEL 0842]